MDEMAVGFVEDLKDHFRELPDPRVMNRCDHRLMDIIAIVMLGTLSGAEDWRDFELYGTERQVWLEAFLELPCGIPLGCGCHVERGQGRGGGLPLKS